MGKFNNLKRVKNNIMLNNEGEIVHSLSSMKTLFMKVLGSFYGEDTFYKSTEIKEEFEKLERLINLISEEDKEYVLKIAELGRYSGMIEYPLYVLTACYNIDKYKGDRFLNKKGQSKIDYYNDKLIRRTSDINNILATQLTMYNGKIPQKMRKNLKMKLQSFDMYKLSKGLDIGKRVSLATSIKLLHPQPKNKEYEKFYKDILEDKVKKGAGKELVDSAVTKITSLEKSQIKENKEVDIEDLRKNLEKSLYNSNLVAILKNIVTLYKYEILNDEKNLLYLYNKITDKNEIKKSLVMPYQVYALYKVLREYPSVPVIEKIREALEICIELSIENVKDIEGYTAYLIDISYSMNSPISKYSGINLREMACLLGAISYKKGKGDMFVFSDTCKRVSLSRNTPIFEIVEKTINSLEHGCTYLDRALNKIESFAKDNEIKYDNLILLSDNDCYCYDKKSNSLKIGDKSLNSRVDKLIKESNILDTVWINNLSGQNFTVFNTEESNKNLIVGYSEKFIDVINLYHNVKNSKDIRPLIDSLLEKYRQV